MPEDRQKDMERQSLLKDQIVQRLPEHGSAAAGRHQGINERYGATRQVDGTSHILSPFGIVGFPGEQSRCELGTKGLRPLKLCHRIASADGCSFTCRRFAAEDKWLSDRFLEVVNYGSDTG